MSSVSSALTPAASASARPQLQFAHAFLAAPASQSLTAAANSPRVTAAQCHMVVREAGSREGQHDMRKVGSTTPQYAPRLGSPPKCFHPRTPTAFCSPGQHTQGLPQLTFNFQP